MNKQALQNGTVLDLCLLHQMPSNMKKHYLTLLLPALLLMLIGEACSSGKAALQRGEYYRSVITSVSRLRSNPDHKKSRRTLREAYQLAVRYELDQANRAVATSQPFKWEQAVGNYERLNHMYDEIQRSPGALSVIPRPASYLNELERARQRAAPERYNAGIAMLERNNREDAKVAFEHFQIANRLVPGYKDVMNKIDEAREAATLKVLVEQIPVPSRRYQLSANFFQDQVESYLVNNQRNQFVRFITPNQTRRGQEQQVDQILRLQFEDFSVGNVVFNKNTEEISRDSVKIGETTLADNTKQAVYGTVKARYTTFRNEIISNGILSMQVIDAQNRNILASDRLRGEYVWFCQWATFQGDERALDDSHMKLTRLEAILPPPAQEMFIEFTRPIYGQLTSRLDEFYRRY